MKITDVSIKRPVFITMVTMGFLIMGFLSVARLGLDLFPDTSLGLVVVNTIYPGASPSEVEERVSDKLEEVVSSISGVKEIRSTSRYSFSQLFVIFDLDVDERRAADEVAEQINAIRPLLPEDVKDPAVLRLDPSAVPIMSFAMRSSRPKSEVYDVLKNSIRPALERLEGVGSVQIRGAQDREIHVDLKRDHMAHYGLSLLHVIQRLGGEIIDVPSGRLLLGATEESVTADAKPRSLEELEDVVLAPLGDKSQIHLKDVANVSLGEGESRSLSRLNGEPALTFDIQKQGGSNTVEVSRRVEEALSTLALPADMHVDKIMDSSEFIQINVDHLWEHLIMGGLMAILVIFVFMLDWRSTVISSVALPVSIIGTFVFMWQLGFTLNIMSMLGLTLAIGILIDDSVVVRENIYRHLEMGYSPKDAASLGTKEIALAVLATTFTILAVFVPVAFTGGLVGKFFKEFGLTVAISVSLSMLVSFTLDPMLSTKLTHTITEDHHEKRKAMFLVGHLLRFYDAMDEAYIKALKWVERHAVLTVLAAVLAFLGSCELGSLMGQDFLPRADRGEFMLSAELPAGSSLEKSTAVAKEIEAILMAHKDFVQVATIVGPNDEVERIQCRVQMSKRKDREESLSEIIEDLRTRFEDFPGVSFFIRETSFVDASMDEPPLLIYLTGDDMEELGRLGDLMLKESQQVAGVRDAFSSYREGAKENRIQIKRDMAGVLGVMNQELAITLRYALEGLEIGKMPLYEASDIPIRLRLQEEDRKDLDALLQLKVGSIDKGPFGEPVLVPLEQVTEIQVDTSPSVIHRLNRERQVTLTANLYGRTLSEVMPELEQRFQALDLPSGYHYKFGGEAERLEETEENMGLAFALAILFIYLVLASQFESFIHPFTIMVALPLAIIGANIGLFVTHQDGSLSTMIGMILLMGLVTKNSILLIDYTNQLRDEGMGLQEALLKACPTRLRPILMTSFAIIFGMLPAAMSQGEGAEFYAPMSIAVIGGVITSTILTLLVVPIFYTWFDRLTIRGRHERREAKAKEA